MLTPRTPVTVRPFDGQLVIPLRRVDMRDDHGPISTFLRPECADLYETRIKPVLGDSLVVSSEVDVWRPWATSYRAAQRKSNASLPGESPHSFGLSMDLDMEKTRANLRTNDKGVRAKLAELGAFPHPDVQRELWHHDLVQCHPAGYRATFKRLFPQLAAWGCYGDVPGMEALWQSALAAVDDIQTGQPYYQKRIDGDWGPGSRAAYRGLAEDWRAAWIRPRGVVDWERAVMNGGKPTDRGRWILATFTARFEVA